MEKIIAEIAETFIKNICKKLCEGKLLTEIEPEILKEAKKCAAKLTETYILQLDAQILASKAARRETGHRIERRGDERKLQTQFGEVCYTRTYYKKASGGYEYLADTFLGIETLRYIFTEMEPAGFKKDLNGYQMLCLFLINIIKTRR